MKIFVFGAGASMDAQQIENPSPGMKAPLMRELFDDRYYTFANEIGLPYDKFVELRTTAGDNVESYLTHRWEERQEHQSRRFREAEQNLFGQLVWQYVKCCVKVQGLVELEMPVASSTC